MIQKKGLSLMAKTIISICCFLAVFVTMVIVVSVKKGAYDLAVSDIIVSLEPGAYLSHNTFAFFFEACGETPIYLLAGLSMAILVWFFHKCCKFRPWNEILSVVAGCLVILAFWFYFKTIVGYVMDHVVGFGWKECTGVYDITKSDVLTLTLLEVAMAIVAAICLVFALKNVKEETLKKLAKWVLAFVIAAAIGAALIEIIKRPMGRMRYRTMNFLGDTEHTGFTAWYVKNGKRYGDDIYKYMADTHDMYKSFPSGHTNAAGTTYALMMLPAVLGIKKKGIKVICWVAPIIYTGLVAVARIVAGAHYFSDVLFGGTISFLCEMLTYEAIICKFKHFKCFKKGYVDPDEAVESSEVVVLEQDADKM